MRALIDSWVELPLAGKAILIVVSGGGLAFAVATLTGSMQVYIIFAIGLAVLAAVFLGYQWFLKRRKKKRSKPFEEKIAGSGGATPREVSDPSRRAQVDSLRKKFEEGLGVYRQRGKDLYSVPWYVVIGEPASGKSAAVRNSGVGFPPGLGEEMQGVGGTINMDWFFTNDAVILDTAGRLAFEEVETAKTSEWKEFLKLLRTARPRCPINGMLLFIPADSLKNDTADELEQKASTIAKQLDFVQQTLGVRFPLFLVVSKADLLVGFSEFFEGIADPREQYQIFGWSNPNPLDVVFQPKDINGVIHEIKERIMRRRSLLLKEPAPQTLVADRRIDEVDRLYLLPDETERIAPRLQRYLELIFAGGQWSSPPPFLRGIYFTSALREGEAVDLALTEAIGVDAADEREDRRWDNKRSFFLHDVFIEKVFQEQGLVTAAPSPGRAKRRRRAALYGAVSAILFVAIGFSVYSAYTFWTDIKRPATYWTSVKDALEPLSRDRVVAFGNFGSGNQYLGGQNLQGVGNATVGTLPDVLATQIDEEPIRASGVFALFDVITGGVEDRQWQAQRALTSTIILNPLVDGVTMMLGDETSKTWTDPATDAYVAALAMWTREVGEERSGAAEDTDEPGADALDATFSREVEMMARYFLGDDWKTYQANRPSVERAVDRAASSPGRGRWPVGTIGLDRSRVKRASDAFQQRHAITGADQARTLIALASAMDEFRSAEQDLIGEGSSWFSQGETLGVFTTERARWEGLLKTLQDRAADADAALAAAEAAGVHLDLESASAVSEAVAAASAAWAQTAIDRALNELPHPEDSGSDEATDAEFTPARLAAELASLRDSIAENASGTLAASMPQTFDVLYSDWIAKSGGERKYRSRLLAYEAAGRTLTRAEFGDATALADLVDLNATVSTSTTEANDTVLLHLTNAGVQTQLSASLGQVTAAGERYLRHRIAMAMLELLASGPAEAAAAAVDGSFDWPSIELPEGMVVGSFAPDAQFEVSGARRVFAAWGALEGLAAQSEQRVVVGRATIAERLADQRAALTTFRDEYLEYWLDDVPQHYAIPRLTWSRYRSVLGNISANNIRRVLSEVAAERERAIDAVSDSLSGEALGDATSASASARAATESLAKSFEDNLLRVVTSWSRLPVEAEAARAQILACVRTEFEAYLFNRNASDADNSFGFGDQLVIGLLGAIAEGSKGELGESRTLVRSVVRQRPFCSSSVENLQDADFEDLSQRMQRVVNASSSSPAAEQFDRESVAMKPLGIPAIDRAVTDLRDISTTQIDEEELEQWQAAVRVAEWLAEEPTLQFSSGGFENLPADLDSDRGSLKYISLNGAQDVLLSMGAPQEFGGPVSLPHASKLRFEFSSSEGAGGDQGFREYSAPWGVLELLASDQAIKSGDNWLVPITSQGSGGRVWLQIAPSVPLPFDPKEWPDCLGGD